MNLSPRRIKSGSNVSDSLERRFAAYGLAASAAGASLLALAHPAEAKIIYTPTHHKLTNGTLPIPIDDTNAFNLTDTLHVSTGSWSTQLLNINAGGSAAVVETKGLPSPLRTGKIIGPKDRFLTGKGLMAGGFCETQISSSRVFGPFANTTRRYLGLKFRLHGQIHYGWARFGSVQATGCRPAVSAILTGYAYETVPNKPIIAGTTKGPPAITLEPDSLGALAAGAAGLAARRSSR
jgi:hypothetical protein